MIVTLFAILGKGVGFVRELYIAHHFGTSSAYDTFLTALTLPLIIGTVLSITVADFLIPHFQVLRSSSGGSTGWVFVRRFGLLATILVFGLIVLLWGIRGPLLAILFPNLSAATQTEATHLFSLALFLIVLLLWEALARSGLQVTGNFVLPALAGIGYNVVVVGILVFFVRPYGSSTLLLSMVAGSAVQVGIMLPWFFPRLRATIDQRTRPLLAGLSGALGYILALAVIGQVFVLVDRHFVGQLTAGSIAALYYANLIIQIPLTLFPMAIGTVVFPTLADAAAKQDAVTLRSLYRTAMETVTVLVIPCALVFCLFGPELVKLLFERGVFNRLSTRLTVPVLCWFSLGLPFLAYCLITGRILLALRKGRLFFFVSAFALGGKIELNYLLGAQWGAAGLAAATSVVAVGSMILFGLLLQSELSRETFRGIFWSVVRVSVLSVVALGLPWGVWRWWLHTGSSLPAEVGAAVVCVVAAVLFAGLARIARVKEVGLVWAQGVAALRAVRS